MNPKSDHPQTKIDAPVLLAITILITIVLQRFVPLPFLPSLPSRIIGVLLFVSGVSIGIPAFRGMLKAKTSPNPHRPTNARSSRSGWRQFCPMRLNKFGSLKVNYLLRLVDGVTTRLFFLPSSTSTSWLPVWKPSCWRPPSACNSFIKTLTAAKENLAKFEAESAEKIRGLPREVSRLFSDAREEIVAMKQPENPGGQKKEGNCKLPEGVCFVKSSLALLQKI